jgi:hypothetical protein
MHAKHALAVALFTSQSFAGSEKPKSISHMLFLNVHMDILSNTIPKRAPAQNPRAPWLKHPSPATVARLAMRKAHTSLASPVYLQRCSTLLGTAAAALALGGQRLCSVGQQSRLTELGCLSRNHCNHSVQVHPGLQPDTKSCRELAVSLYLPTHQSSSRPTDPDTNENGGQRRSCNAESERRKYGHFAGGPP